MDTTKLDYYNFLFLYSIFILVHFYSSNAQDLKACGFDAMYQLGDSISDTGNSIMEFSWLPYSRFPYGQTIKKPTGRPSDGMLMVDYFAQSAGLPWLEAYENPKANLNQGVNFAVAGVTAVSADTLVKWNIKPFVTNNSLTVQAQWLTKYLSTRYPDATVRQEKQKSALFIVGTIGFNDYNMALGENRSLEEIRNVMVPVVVQTVIDVVKQVINLGATRVVVPGTFQMGCTPGLLTYYSVNASAVFDAQGCLKDFNDFFMHHNVLLKAALEELRKQYPNVHIAYADLYSALQSIADNLSNYGFKAYTSSCCGSGGKYNFSREKMCGNANVPVCSNPLEYVFWDAGHFTHQANNYLSQWLIKSILPQLQCT